MNTSLFQESDNGVYRAELLLGLGWLEHGFGSRKAGPWVPRERLLTLIQTHSADVFRGTSPGHREREGDGLISDKTGLMIGVRTADCQSVLIADTEHRAVAAVHAGWRGAASRIVERSLEALTRDFGTKPERVAVAIGPSIRGCCYEVGPEVAAAFGLEVQGNIRIDLPEITVGLLRDLGVPREAIAVAPVCTACDPAFHSWRRDRDDGRMLSAIGVR